jgi:GntR family transcriptional repressor for pyruvate dehydrogenase complex
MSMAPDMASDLRTERKPKLSERIVTALRDRILSGEIAPGQKLPTEGQLTETYKVSRTVIREAIASLAADGLVESRQGAGVFVLDHPAHAFSTLKRENKKISQAINVLEVRMGIEIESAGLAAMRRNAAQEARIQEAFFEFERMLKLREPTGKADFAFHLEIASARNPRSFGRADYPL